MSDTSVKCQCYVTAPTIGNQTVVCVGGVNSPGAIDHLPPKMSTFGERTNMWWLFSCPVRWTRESVWHGSGTKGELRLTKWVCNPSEQLWLSTRPGRRTHFTATCVIYWYLAWLDTSTFVSALFYCSIIVWKSSTVRHISRPRSSRRWQWLSKWDQCLVYMCNGIRHPKRNWRCRLPVRSMDWGRRTTLLTWVQWDFKNQLLESRVTPMERCMDFPLCIRHGCKTTLQVHAIKRTPESYCI